MKRFSLILLALLFLLGLPFLPLPIPPYLDFQVIYHVDIGLLRGIPVYDHAGQVNMIAQLSNVPPQQVFVLPFPYPPWYALIALPLALIPIALAARIWFEFNLIMLMASIVLLTDGQSPMKRLTLGLAVLIFPPVLGTLFVGQYVLPVLLGISLWIYAVRKESVWLIAISSALLTFKPHLGALILLVGLLYLVLRRDDFGRRAILYTIIAGFVLFCVGFLADPVWPLNYIHSLLAFRQESGVSTCGLCASLPVALASFANNIQVSFASAPILGLFILIGLCLWWGLKRSQIINEPVWLMAIAILFVLLASPYLLNYDYVLLIMPFLFIFENIKNHTERFFIILAYLIPTFAIGIWGRQGNLAFSASTVLLLLLAYRLTGQLDELHSAAYNPVTTK